MNAIILFILGCTLIAIAIYVEMNHEEIWKNYKKSYKASGNKYVDTLTKPSENAYRLNRFVVWPVVGTVGFLAVSIAIATFIA